MSKQPEKPRDVRVFAGELVLALADDDGPKVAQLLHELSKGKVGTVALIIELARSEAVVMQALAGDAWRDILNHSLLGLSVEDIGGGDV